MKNSKEVLEGLRKLGKLSIVHNRKVNYHKLIGTPFKYFEGLDGFMRPDSQLPEYISVKRFYDSEWAKVTSANLFIFPYGGYCEVSLTTDNEGPFYGMSRCSPEDHYCKPVALTIALDRLVHEIRTHASSDLIRKVDQCLP